MAYRYVVLGAGIQGVAIAYDMAKFGDAEQVLLLDVNADQAAKAAQHINDLLGYNRVQAGSVDVRNKDQVMTLLHGAHSCLSAVPYQFNADLAEWAVEAGVHFNDLGGNTAVVFKELELHEKALAKGVSVVPDCGVAPGLANTLAAHGISQLDSCEEVQTRCGGLPQNPKPPLDYMLVFSVGGLTNEYFGKAVILRDGKRVEVDTFDELETIQLPEPLGECEAFTTSGGTSTTPWTYEGQVNTYEYKTIRYKGHFEKMKVMKDLGLLELEPVMVDGQPVVPRHLFHEVVTPRLTFADEKDLLVLRVTCRGIKDGLPRTLEYTIVDYQDDETGFNAMSRMTGFPASIVSIMQARGETLQGAVPLEKAVPTEAFLVELAKRGIHMDVKVS